MHEEACDYGSTRNLHSLVEVGEAAGGLGLWKSLPNGHPSQHFPNGPARHKSSNVYSSFAAQLDDHV